MVCDGAKTSCALKIYSSVQAAGLAARMALNGIAPGRESGIIGKDAMESIDNLMKVSHNGMVDTDKVILSIMLDKQL
jgi:L-cysteine desulfidase